MTDSKNISKLARNYNTESELWNNEDDIDNAVFQYAQNKQNTSSELVQRNSNNDRESSAISDPLCMNVNLNDNTSSRLYMTSKSKNFDYVTVK